MSKTGAMLDEGLMAQTRAKTVQQEREEVFAALQYAASFHCLVEERKDCEEMKPQPKEKWTFVDEKKEETRDRTERCAAVSNCPMSECGRGNKYMKMQRKCTGPKHLAKNLEKCRKQHMGGNVWYTGREKF